MKAITPLRQKSIDHLTLRQLSERTIETYIHWVADLARFHKASPDALGRPEISSFVLHLIQERKLSDCSVTLAIKPLRCSLHVLPEGFTKIRHYGLLGNNRRKRMLPLAREALKGSRWHVAIAPAEAHPVHDTEEDTACMRCGAAEPLCIGRLDAQRRLSPLAEGARRARIQLGEPPAIGDTS